MFAQVLQNCKLGVTRRPGAAPLRIPAVTGGSAPVTLTYDPFGRLASYTASGAVTSFRYAGPNLAAEYSGTTWLRSYVSGEGGG